MNFLKIVTIVAILCFGCKEQRKAVSAQNIYPDKIMLDSISLASDTFYSKKYPRSDFATAEYFESKKDSTVTQVMKDKDSVIRQIIIARNKTRTYFAQFYPNAQLMAKYMLDEFGQYNGPSEEYYENGHIKRSGEYSNGLYSGSWKNYDENGTFLSTDLYDENGQRVNQK